MDIFAYEIWQDLHDRSHQGHVFRIYDLQKDIYSMKQCDLPITINFTPLKKLWRDLENFCLIPTCSCHPQCTCSLLPKIRNYFDNGQVIRFLKGFNEQYALVRSRIMLMRLLPLSTRCSQCSSNKKYNTHISLMMIVW